MTRTDAHIHLFEHGFSGARPPGAELADYERLRRRHDIDCAVVVGYEGEPLFSGNNEYVLTLAGEHDWIVPLYYLHPDHADADEVRQALQRGARGFSLYTGADATVAGRIPREVWEMLAAHRSLLSVNATPAALPSLAPIAAALGEGTLLISHLGLPGRAPAAGDDPGDRMAELVRLAPHDNVLVKLSGLYAIDPVHPHSGAVADTVAVLDAFGPHRLVWGSDFSPGLDALSEDELFTIPEWVEDLLGVANRDDFLHMTLLRAIGRD